jgi:NitT/TauT family transport system substrate-binding protein
MLVKDGLGARWLDPDKIVRPTPMEVVGYMVNTEWAARDPAAAHRLMTAFARAGRDYCQAYHHGPNRAEVSQTLVENKVFTDRALIEQMPWQARDPNGRFNLASLVDQQNWFFAHGMIQGRVPPERLVDPSYAEDAARELGPFDVVNKDSTLAGCR